MRLRFSVIAVFLLGCLYGCRDSGKSELRQSDLQSQIDSLKLLVQRLQPGLGEVMSAIQMHHAKLWFSGINENWELAAFEIGEIKEQLDAALRLAPSRPEIASLPM